MNDIKVYSLEGCADTPATVERVKKIASDLNLEIKVSQIEVSSAEEVDHHQFPGSPTVRINGVDIEPDMRDTTHFGLT